MKENVMSDSENIEEPFDFDSDPSPSKITSNPEYSPNELASLQSGTTGVVHEWEDYEDLIGIKYDHEYGPRGSVHIFNYYKFSNPAIEDFPPGDGQKLLNIFKHLNYKVKLHENLTKFETDKAFESIQHSEGLAVTNVLMFFILSHGSDVFTFFSSDFKRIDLEEKMLMFRKDSCKPMAHKPKIWFGDFCRGSNNERGVGPFESDSDLEMKDANAILEKLFDNEKSAKGYVYGKTEVLSNAMYVMSSHEGIASMSDGGGSCFTNTICKMFQKGYYQLDTPWFNQLNTLLRKDNNPSGKVRMTADFLGPLFSKGFSFNYDVDMVEKKKNAR